MQPSRQAPRATAPWGRRGIAASCFQHSGATSPAAVASSAQACQPKSFSNALQDFQHPISIEQFRHMGYEAIDLICDYLTWVLPHARVVPDIQPGYLRLLLPASAPAQPESWAQVKQDFWNIVLPGVTHWQSPHNFAWFPANTSLPGVLAELLGAALNMVGFHWTSAPVSTELEVVVLDWLAKLCGLPDKFLWSPPPHTSTAAAGGAVDASASSSATTSSTSSSAPSSSNTSIGKSPGGVIQGSSSEAVLVALLAAKARALAGQPPEAASRLVAYSSNQATMVAGLQHSRLLPATAATHFALQPQQLSQAIEADLQLGLIPFYFMATIGTTSSCAVDPVSDLADVCAQYGIWMHVDAAWAGTAALLPEQRHWFAGLDKVDSYSFNPYKWMLTPMGVCACWFADSTHLRAALSITPTYLRTTNNTAGGGSSGGSSSDAGGGGSSGSGSGSGGSSEMPEFKDWEIPLGRRFRSLDLWFVLRMYGSEAIKAMVRHHIALGQWLAQQVAADDRFEVAAPPRFGLTCLRLKGVGCEGNRQLLAAVNRAGPSHFVGTDLDGLFTLRVAVGQANTQLEHVRQLWSRIQEEAGKVLEAQTLRQQERGVSGTAKA